MRRSSTEVLPLAVGATNAEVLTGLSFRYLRDHREELGIELVQVGGKAVFLASDVLAALERRRKTTPIVEHVDELEQLRARLREVG